MYKSDNVGEYEISGFGWYDDTSNYVTLSKKYDSDDDGDDDEYVDIPVPLHLDGEWLRKIEEFNREQFNR